MRFVSETFKRGQDEEPSTLRIHEGFPDLKNLVRWPDTLRVWREGTDRKQQQGWTFTVDGEGHQVLVEQDGRWEVWTGRTGP